MKLSIEEFKAHIETMWTKKQKAQLELWIDHGLLIYSNFSELRDIWDEEYADEFSQL